MSSSDLVDIELCLWATSASGKAILVSNDEDSEKVWLPLSQVEFIYKSKRVIEATMPEWLAKEKELE